MPNLGLGTFHLEENDPMVGQYDQEEFVLDNLPSSSQQIAQPYTAEEHAELTLQFFRKIRGNNKFNDVTLESNEKAIIVANRLVLAAFSLQLESALMSYQESNSITLNLQEEVLNVAPSDVMEIVEYMYTGEFHASQSLRKAAEALGCRTLSYLLVNVEDGCFLRDESHAYRFLRKIQTYRANGWFLDCNILIPNKSPLKCHRLILSAHSLNIEEPLMETEKTGRIHLDLDHNLMKVSSTDLTNILEFAYTGILKGGRRRFALLRSAAFDLGVMKLYELLNVQISLQEEENVLGLEPLNIFMAISDNFLDLYEDENYLQQVESNVKNEEDLTEFENDDTANTLEDVTAQATEDYVSIYEEYVLGPRRGRRGGTYGLNKWKKGFLLKGNTIVTLTDTVENNDSKKQVPALLVSYTPSSNKPKTKPVDSYGYGLPEYQSSNDIEIPLVFGDQKEMMSKPFKCPHCEHRGKEKSAIDKHVRSVHTFESPYKCKYCHMSFKVQSNLVRHIRAHTGEKPYACKKCGIAYADKKNMDAHIFREHLKTQPIFCPIDDCNKKFWRHDRFSTHCIKAHGTLPNQRALEISL